MNRGIKIAAGIILGLVALVVIAAILVVLFVDLNRFKPQIEQAVQTHTGRTLKIAGELSWSLYPVLGIELGQTTLSNAPGFGEEPMVSVEQVSVGVALLPLLQGNLGVSELVLKRPRIHLARKADGTTNWQDLVQQAEQAEAAEPKPEEAEAGAQPLNIAIEGIQLTEAEVLWVDEANGQQVRIAPLTLVTGPVQPGEPTDIALSLALANAQPQVDANLRLTSRIASARDLSWVQWQDLALQLQARGEAIPAQSATLALDSAGRLSLKDQQLQVEAASLTFQVPGLNETLNAQGRLDLTLTGDLNAQRFESPQMKLEALVEGPDLPGGRTQLELTTPFAIDLQQQTLSLPELVAQVLDLNLKAQVEGSRIIDEPQFQGSLQLAAFAPRALLTRLGVELPAMADPQTLSQASFSTRFSATPASARLDQLQIALDETRGQGSLEARLGETRDIRFDLALDRIDLDRYLPPPAPEGAETGAGSAPRTAAEAPAQTAGAGSPAQAGDPFAWLDGLTLNGALKFAEVTVKKVALTDILVNVRAQDRILTVEPSLSVFGGRQTVQARVDARGEQPKTELKTSLRTLNVGALLGSFMDQAPLEGSGSMDLALNLEGLSLEQIQRSLQGGGELRINDGAFNGVSIVQSIRNNLASLRGQPVEPVQKETKLRDFITKFAIEEGSLKWQQLNAEAGGLQIQGTGGVELFTQKLDTLLNVTIPKNLEDKNDLLKHLAGQTVPVQLAGTITDPRVELDLKGLIQSQVEQKIDSKVEEKKGELQQKLDQKLQKGLDKLFKR